MNAKQESREIIIKSKALVCPICENRHFLTRRSLLNTRGLTFLNLDWANRDATNYICENCGYIYWFYNF